MAVKTHNIYGKIVISNYTIASFVSEVALDCYGIAQWNKKPFSKRGNGVTIHTSGDRITITVSVIVKYGVSMKAVIESLKESIKYKVEKFTGMIVDTINVNVMGVSK